ncbi:fluoride efflux transporter CrcB [Halalkalibacterium halodurans]|jgi:CrcB protein|uniref:Fluoride-specific ion channel FluC 1 n=2 Tax=Halalkalibacterium halodurans TaxID=86665 RepID=FLUC1_HALH5|nr:fluoride efflux transporter CrcB [Halalkalibacterium halodurans]Q9K8M0.1 RecName: Full=Fluoride-specific ion channel FluC 1 [Halalkalibacterium halodurans C-125]MDY7223530.1 fluoride efflux transporter CrcB [Halalkalibacterium halodurans]MDY7242751.1 fluoride efflux transporter CrcB [Halalkalibacterium halodurans]MED3646551.1 fluoride efflux transporter CrcB [Halalkalibacterium halodurans]MED4082802.1 fluoride efflux transporter CrcB [Halalkalibacterium halodurans]MED4085961.1 fluoride eff
MNLLIVAIGGGIGAIARYLVGQWMMKRFPDPPFPIAMLVVNLLGSFGLGAFFGLYYHELFAASYDDIGYLFGGIGFFGAFTTYSTFSVEAVLLIREREWKKLFSYVLLSIVGSIAAFLLGFYGTSSW